MQFNSINGNDLLNLSLQNFERTAINLYHYQYEHNELYRGYNEALKINPTQIHRLEQIPFLPISFFKSHQVKCFAGLQEEVIFDSSGTSGMIPSKHYVLDSTLYNEVSFFGFEQVYGAAKDWVILALLPSYLERKTSSLVHMAKMLMDKSGHEENGFYLNEYAALYQKLMELSGQHKKVLLLGVTFALLDFAEQYPMDLNGVVVMETGGMKGRQAEWTRAQVHEFLTKQWRIPNVHSEYGMTELLSQAYAPSQGVFHPIPTMKVLIRELDDPLETKPYGNGVLNVIDLANVHSCAFIATEDLGKVNADGSFEVLGRMDFAALRGCSLLAV